MDDFETNLDFYILDSIDRAGGSIDFVTLLNQNPTKAIQIQDMLKHMRSQGKISGTFEAYSKVHIEPSGLDFLLQLRKRQADEASEIIKAKEIRMEGYRHNWKVALTNSIVSAITGGIMGLITSFIFWLCTKQ